MLQSENISDLVAALAKAQSVLSAPPRNREVEVTSKRTGGKYTFKYATLDAIIEHVRAPLTANGLWFVQALANSDGKYILHTKIVHSSGQWISSETPILTDTRDNQDFGAAITYMKRYSLAAILGVAADEDTDAQPQKVKAPVKAKETPEQAAKNFYRSAVEMVNGLQTRAELLAWQKQNDKAIERLSSYGTMKDDLLAHIDDRFNTLPSEGKAA